MEAVRQWLEGEERDYAAGVALYAQLGTSQVVKHTLAYGATAFTRAKLEAVLRALAAGPEAVGAVAPAPVAPPAGTSAADPQRRDWFAERNYLHPQLALVATDGERGRLAHRILELARLIGQSYDRAAGRLPAAAPVAPAPDLAAIADEGRIRQLLANLRPQRSKLKNRPDRAEALAQVVADITLLESKLKPHE